MLNSNMGNGNYDVGLSNARFRLWVAGSPLLL